MQVPVQPLAPDTVIRERYKIHSSLGQGGMSRVYLATDLSLDVRVALKENLQTDPQARAQFHREAEFLARLSHPNLPRVTDYFDDMATGRQYLVMDYIEGEDLRTLMERQGPLHEDRAVPLIVQVLDALEYMHHQQTPIIHRDIKPSNIKITPQGKAMLVDFGIAKAYEATALTMTGARAVTPGFAPPEQYGMRTDARSDIYAVGATLYNLLTGQVPPESTLRVANLATLPPLRTLIPKISPQVDSAVQLAMEPDTKRRWPDAESFRAALSAPTQTASPAAARRQPRPPAQPASIVMPASMPEATVSPTIRAAPPRRSLKRPLAAFALLAAILAIGGGAFFLANNAGSLLSTIQNQAGQPIAKGVETSPTTTQSSHVTSDITATQTTAAQNLVTPTSEAIGFAATQTASARTAPVVPSSAPATSRPLALTPTLAPPTNTATPQGPATVAVVNVQLDPAEARRNQQVTFFVAFRNTFNAEQSRTWSIWIYQQANLRNTFWHSRPQTTRLPVGDVELSTLPSDTWCVCGPGGAENFIVYVEDADAGAPVPALDGHAYAKAITINP